MRGTFNRDDPAALRINVDDTVVYRTLDSSWGRVGEEAAGIPRQVTGALQQDTGHALCGPLAVDGAEAGDALEIHIRDVLPARWGWTWNGPRPLNPRYEMGVSRDALIQWDIRGEANMATARSLGVTVRTRPFMGVMGNAPCQRGAHSTTPPRRVGGNIDCREFTRGTILLLPIEVDEALFFVGDGHAAQGDGEVGQTAIECAMTRVELTFGLRKSYQLQAPEALTPAGYVTIGIGPNLDDASTMALDGIVRHIQSVYKLERPEAMAIASVAASLRVTQVVNGDTVGVHALLPTGVLGQTS